jgi:hypothetical protein
VTWVLGNLFASTRFADLPSSDYWPRGGGLLLSFQQLFASFYSVLDPTILL